ncbi:uncharacterized protein LOC120353378 [Nilaparvata lugens]|uniref:uncharacterized protein LOC120353378 n=1 Tax=Nilaparvata lugens TaxID=108931 RepID=UPI00193E1ACC|nr:uncharacterized protein LOC120353378 [Nilaparvata lugens]
MVFELGPQKETQPLVKVTGFTDDSEETRKRHIPKSLQYYAPAPHAAQVSDDEPMQVQHSGTPKGWLSAWKNAFSGGGKSVFSGGGNFFNGGGKSVLSGGKSSFNGGGTAFGKNGGGKSLNSLRRSEKKWELETNELRYPGYLPGGYFSKSYHRHQPLAESLQRFNGYPGKMNHATVNHLRQLYKEQPMK